MKRIGIIFMLILLVVGMLPLGVSAAPDLQVEAKSAVLMDVATGTVLYEQNAHETLAPASVTKVMTMLLVMEAIETGRIGWEDPVTTSEAAAAKGGSQVYLKVGEQMSVRDMIKAVAVSSANDCACALAEHISGSESAFAEAMNSRAKALGMENTYFVNCTGLDDDEGAKDHKTTAYDIALMSRQLLKNHPAIKEYTTIWMDTLRNGTFGLSNTNKLVRFYPGATGLKTGFTSRAGYCLSASALRDGMELVAVVMGSETSAKRFAACKAMLDYGFAGFALVQPELPADTKVPVKLGTESVVNAAPAEHTPILVEKALRGSVTFHAELETQVTAPVSLGQRLGTFTVKAGEHVLQQMPMVATQTVPRLTWWQTFGRVFQNLFSL